VARRSFMTHKKAPRAPKPPSFQIQFVGPDGTTTKGPLLVPSDGPARVRAFGEERWDQAQTVRRFAGYLERRDRDGLEASIRAMNRLDCWCEAIGGLTVGPRPNVVKGRALLSFWNDYGLHSVPRGLRENLFHFVDALTYLLPPYAGAGLTLYRGELEARYSAGICGISWTPMLEKAREFANRRFPDEGQGTVLMIEANPETIVAAMRDHSDHTLTLGEDEYIVDPRTIQGRVVIVG
jgi:hypothetical protein